MFDFLFFLPCDFFCLISVSVVAARATVAGVLFCFDGACCWYSGLGVLTVDAVCFSIHSTLAASTVDDTGALSCLLWSPAFLILPLFFFSHRWLLMLCIFHIITNLIFLSFPFSSSSNSLSFLICSLFLQLLLLPSFPPSPHNHLPPPLPLAKVHVINQTKMRLCLRLAMVESYI